MLYKNKIANNQVISVDGDPIDFADLPMLDGIPVLFEREDDWSVAVLFFSLDKPENNLPELMDVSERTTGLVMPALALWENIYRQGCAAVLVGSQVSENYK